jgi:hypothetical protein
MLVDLYNCENEEWVKGMRSAGAGDYLFDQLEDGFYHVVVTNQADYEFTIKDSGSDDDIDSDVYSSSGRSDCIEISMSGNDSIVVNAGLVKGETESSPLDSDLTASTALPTGSPVANSADANDEDDVEYNCRGQPCTEGDGTWCRSRYNYCGEGEEYCNEESQWKPDCPSKSPTLSPISPTSSPTSGQPTFVHDSEANCSGEPCEEGDGTWCRSEIGFCGNGELYCNYLSTWIPQCIESVVTTAIPTQSSNQSASSKVPTMVSLNVTANETVPASEPSEDESSFVPTQSPNDSSQFSSFSKPTLPQIKDPKISYIDVTSHGGSVTSDSGPSLPSNTSSSAFSVPDNESQSSETKNTSISENETEEQSGVNENVADISWYTRYTDMQPIPRGDASALVSSWKHSFSVILLVLLF